MKKIILFSFALILFTSLRSSALNVTIIQSPGYSMDSVWYKTCLSMGHTVAIYSATELDLVSNLSATDILIISSALDVNLTVARTGVIQQYLLNGGKAYIQSEYLSTYPGNIAYQSLVDSLGGYFNWTGVVSGTLAPMNIIGSITTDFAVTAPLPYFWYGQSIDPCSSVEMFLSYQGNYFGSIYCVPSSSGRVITSSDQDWVNAYSIHPETDSLMKNIIYNLAKTTYNCSNSGSVISVSLGRDTTLCNGNSIVLTPGAGYSTYLWTGGQTAASISVSASGSYWVRVTSPCGSSASDTINIALQACNNLPVASLLSSDSTFCANNCINYTDLSTNSPTSWFWTFQGGLPATSTDQNPQNICYPNGGNFNVTLVATNGSGSDTAIYSNFISVFNAPPTPNITQSHDTLYCSSDPSYTSYQWYDDTTLIPGATHPYLVIAHGGNYNVQVRNENGCSIAVGYNAPQGIQNFFFDNSISISPNPAGDELRIKNDRLRIEKIMIYNVLGEVIKVVGEDSEKDVTIDLKDISAGVYFVQMITLSRMLTGRFVKE